ncbi:class I SAM-dependent methyltransferase [Afifella marina]|uniref:tRNA (Cmo5U34)-methyltransferase n=1 Tax=Afifella marina DSM 2698 TaxID=1120955 RepID=A0A1G5P8P2_AFIMA|nr:class I SAM-dependent methyltransferase [Afifella marina]MBK1625350.1 class I SAM-dependent methyltransferase [Afifella marina DSM 2698]MBK1628892.1 class I SAM-dependent methyltransferase [Afifella marina]MBK5916894.1 methyltransferase [Afifella marina]RAI17892.1 methyltransferase [Afifella marina DSM 2698]SCZ45932.1 tRNA (cmo5U34)-methyltransferase [Afifella marina DSM 2698]
MPSETGPKQFLERFSDPQAIARYEEGVRRFVPALDALHRMAGILLAERVREGGKILVLGAGGGLETRALAKAYPDWSFVGIDPAQQMLDLAERTLGALASRVEFVTGTIGDAPEGPFDGATCLLTLHFLDARERQQTAEAIRRRLRPGAPLVVAHSSFPQGEGERDHWLARYAAYAKASGADPGDAENARAAVAASLDLFNPDKDAAILSAAGFQDVSLFFAAFTWRGWIGYA